MGSADDVRDMTRIYVVGVGLDGPLGLPAKTLSLISKAHLLVGGTRLLQSFAEYQGEKWELKDFSSTLERIDAYIEAEPARICVILATGDPLFFGFGRLVLSYFPAEQLTFLPTVSSVQLAFSRLKLPWQDATLISAHGRDFDTVLAAVRKGVEKIAILTDPVHSPAAIATMILSLGLPVHYQAWVCENLGAEQERVIAVDIRSLRAQSFDSLAVLVLVRQDEHDGTVDLAKLPFIGISDALFHTFRDRPGLMTKREIRLLALGELALHPDHICWDIGAGTGSMSVEMARISSRGQVFAVEKSMAGIQLIHQNMKKFGLSNLMVTQGMAPEVIRDWPRPDRIFIGGSGQKLTDIVEFAQTQLALNGKIVLAITTLEHFSQAVQWFERHRWNVKILHVQLSRSVPIADLTRLQPLNPIYLITADLN